MKYTLLFTVALFFACTSEDAINKIIIPNTEEEIIDVKFESVLETVIESESTEVRIIFDKATSADGFVEIAYATNNAVYNETFNAVPAFENELLKINFSEGSEQITFDFTSITDSNMVDEVIEFSIIDASAFLQFNSSSIFKISIDDKTEDSVNEDDLTVVTWNIEHFPLNGSTTINAIKDIILNMDADIIALQEMDDIDAFGTLVDAIDGWEGELYDVRGGIEIAYMYKSSEITAFSALSVIYNDDSSPFPRQPVLLTATHKNGLEITFINIHLKCCGDTGDKDRREHASELLKTYIDQNLDTENVIVLGDYNDHIVSGSPFSNFISDTDNFLFADMEIANGSSSLWSYPSWPSHLDHILMSNELIDNFVSSETLPLNTEVSGYTSNVSDHLPVTATFSN